MNMSKSETVDMQAPTGRLLPEKPGESPLTMSILEARTLTTLKTLVVAGQSHSFRLCQKA